MNFTQNYSTIYFGISDQNKYSTFLARTFLQKTQLLLVTPREWRVGVVEMNPTANKREGELSKPHSFSLFRLCRMIDGGRLEAANVVSETGGTVNILDLFYSNILVLFPQNSS